MVKTCYVCYTKKHCPHPCLFACKQRSPHAVMYDVLQKQGEEVRRDLAQVPVSIALVAIVYYARQRAAVVM